MWGLETWSCCILNKTVCKYDDFNSISVIKCFIGSIRAYWPIQFALFRWTWGPRVGNPSVLWEDPQFLFDLRGQRAPLRSNFKSWPEIYFLKGWLDMGSWDVNFRAIDTLDFVNVTLVLVYGSLIFQHGWSGFASMNFGSGKNIAITQDKTWLRQEISISRIFDAWSHWTHWRQCFFHVRSTWPGQ